MGSNLSGCAFIKQLINYNVLHRLCLTGIWHVAMEKNNRYNETTKETPYNLLFGQTPRVNISDMPFDKKLLKSLATESELENLLGVESYLEEHPAAVIEILDNEPTVVDIATVMQTDSDQNHGSEPSTIVLGR